MNSIEFQELMTQLNDNLTVTIMVDKEEVYHGTVKSFDPMITAEVHHRNVESINVVKYIGVWVIYI
jgi:small nuclear ribonucleoprotein (snRNP)-like protein